MYKLRYEAAVEAVWDALPEEARDELDRAVVGLCEAPYASSEADSEDGDVKRILTLQHTVVVFLVFEAPVQRVRILYIGYLG